MNREWLRDRLGLDQSFDLLWREVEVGGSRAGLLAVRGLVREDVLERVLALLQHLPEHRPPGTPGAPWASHAGDGGGAAVHHEGGRAPGGGAAEAWARRYLSPPDIETLDTLEAVAERVLRGSAALFLEGAETAVTLGVAAPASVPLGAASGFGGPGGPSFAGHLRADAALLRRFLPLQGLRVECIPGSGRGADMAIAYVRGLADAELVARVREALRVAAGDGPREAARALAFVRDGRRGGARRFPAVHRVADARSAAGALRAGRVAVLQEGVPEAWLVPASLRDPWISADGWAAPRSAAQAASSLAAGWVLLPAALLLPAATVQTRSLWLPLIGAEAVLALTRAALAPLGRAAPAWELVAAALLAPVAVAAGLISARGALLAIVSAAAAAAVPGAELRTAICGWRAAATAAAGLVGVWGVLAATALAVVALLRGSGPRGPKRARPAAVGERAGEAVGDGPKARGMAAPDGGAKADADEASGRARARTLCW
ncbi:MAG: spore germination protein [Firmicutes bacterium]|nr:spore germination protein [Bacillota bacterium]